ncbi:MBL fold metallo-hydrolase [Candidatus Nitrosarchaeum limnium]|uniref:MBL fold metallo-hydrolase n=1 Tax=Candidatus Nitrosarchaeum limnium TaxID=1007084 RepID=UPI00026CE38F|nr:MBL fold metallo-hydrolase [Candidatus Nitrosarchaeum limnium]
MTSLTFYGGVNEIGGNKILLQDKDTKVFLDFGKSFSRRAAYFEEFLNPRTSNGIVDFLSMGLVPDIKGVYRDDLMVMAGRKPEEPDIDAVLLTHAHADHADYISFLHEDIPIHMGSACHLILKALAERSSRTIEREILDYKPRPYSVKDEPIKRKINEFRTGDKFKVGSLEVEPIHVDHSVPGAYGFIIWTSEGPVAYTGDIRLHGTHSEMTTDFIERAKEVKPIALISEGTRIADEEREESEQLVYQQSKKTVEDTKNLVFADFNFKDVDRLMTFYKIAKETGRKFVVKINDAFFLKHLSQDKHLSVPNIDDEDIVIYLPKRGSGQYSEKDYKGKDKEFIDLHNAWTAEQIAQRPDKVLCAIGFYSFTALIDMMPKPGARYIHSSSEPYNEEQKLSKERQDAWLKHFGMQMFQSHCSGHARGGDLLTAVSEIDAKMLFPVHTEHPDAYKKIAKGITIVEEGVKYDL